MKRTIKNWSASQESEQDSELICLTKMFKVRHKGITSSEPINIKKIEKGRREQREAGAGRGGGGVGGGRLRKSVGEKNSFSSFFLVSMWIPIQNRDSLQ